MSSTRSGSHGAPNTCVARIALGPVELLRPRAARSIWNVVGQALDERGRRARSTRPRAPDAENVKLGSTTGPGRPSVSACNDEHQARRARADRDDVRDAEPFGDALLELGHERAVREHAAVVRGLQPAHRPVRAAGGPAGRTADRARTSVARRAAPGAGAPVLESDRSRVGAGRPRSTSSGTAGSAGTVSTAIVGARHVGCRGDTSRRLRRSICVEQPTTTCVGGAPSTARDAARRGSRAVAGSGRRTFGVRPRIDGWRVGSIDLGVVVQLLVQPFTRPRAGDLDLDVLVGAEARRGGSSAAPAR